MDIFKIAATGIVGAFLAVMLKSYKKEMAMAVSLATGLVITVQILLGISGAFDAFAEITEKSGVKTEYFVIVLKVIGIAYASQLGAELCRDAGENAIAVKVETAAKIIITIITLPIIKMLLETVAKILGGG